MERKRIAVNRTNKLQESYMGNFKKKKKSSEETKKKKKVVKKSSKSWQNSLKAYRDHGNIIEMKY